MENQVEKELKLTLREKMLLGLGFAAGVIVMIPVCKMMHTKEETIVKRINADLREMFFHGEIVGTGDFIDGVLQFRKN